MCQDLKRKGINIKEDIRFGEVFLFIYFFYFVTGTCRLQDRAGGGVGGKHEATGGSRQRRVFWVCQHQGSP